MDYEVLQPGCRRAVIPALRGSWRLILSSSRVVLPQSLDSLQRFSLQTCPRFQTLRFVFATQGLCWAPPGALCPVAEAAHAPTEATWKVAEPASFSRLSGVAALCRRV